MKALEWNDDSLWRLHNMYAGTVQFVKLATLVSRPLVTVGRTCMEQANFCENYKF